MKLSSFDHIVLCVGDVAVTIAFYRDVLGMDAREERPGKWSLYFGNAKISLQDQRNKPALAVGTLPGTANFCVLSQTDVDEVAETLRQAGVDILDGPGIKSGATGPIRSVYFRDPDGNLVEIANPA